MVALTNSDFTAEPGWTGESIVMLPVMVQVNGDGVVHLHVGDPAREYKVHSNGPQVGTLSVVGNARP